MRTILILLTFILIGHLSMAQNILISNQNSPNEPSIMINPKHPNVLIAGANLDNYYISTDTGYTWKAHTLSSMSGVWGDPTIIVDTSNSFYFFHLSNPASGLGTWVDRIVCQKTINNGTTWTGDTYVGRNGIKVQDKQWCVVDRTNNNMYLTWTQFDKYKSINPNDSSIILFSKSTDAGNNWTAPLRINKLAGDCLDGSKTVEGAVPAVGPNGEIYVAWAGPDGLVFNKSLNQGATWLPKETLIDPMPTGWYYDIPGLYRGNGLPVTVCDLSQSSHRGTIYVNWSDQRNGINNTDIWLSKSTDGGVTWSGPQRVNDDNSKRHQFLTWMTIDQTNGNLYFVFYDRRNYTDVNTDVYLAISTDGGNSFINRKISQSPFMPTSSVFFGDYTNITAHNGIIRPIWARMNNGQLSLWTDITKLNDLLFSTEEPIPVNNSISLESFPNPSGNYIYVSFKLHAKENVNLDILDLQGHIIAELISNENRDYGKYVESIDLNKFNLSPGMYLIRLRVGANVKITKQIVTK